MIRNPSEEYDQFTPQKAEIIPGIKTMAEAERCELHNSAMKLTE